MYSLTLIGWIKCRWGQWWWSASTDQFSPNCNKGNIPCMHAIKHQLHWMDTQNHVVQKSSKSTKCVSSDSTSKLIKKKVNNWRQRKTLHLCNYVTIMHVTIVDYFCRSLWHARVQLLQIFPMQFHLVSYYIVLFQLVLTKKRYLNWSVFCRHVVKINELITS